ncbi:T9SS type A sorting domain-containing protein [Flavobacterium sp.]|uniref:T9SS type A sorting domain-containing protein n=1 Tax=Flavobacterium sp. TaxID=239 RepID=UPI002869F98E|nr:T9SS type A sorting domain-containing protein [Flavobacterium sp.]
MKKLLLLTLLFGTISSYSQIKILFEYDTAGNQVKRSLCINCIEYDENGNPTSKEIAKIKDENLIKAFPEDAISYYPNPVKEELYLKWELVDNNKVSLIQIYSLTGQLVGSYNKLENTNEKILYFQKYPQGVYDLLILYTNGEQKSIKIIKN